jgi:hypothetical protein
MTMAEGNTLVRISATTMWTLRNRATEAMRGERVLDDPWGVELFGFFGAVDYDHGKFGNPHQYHPRRALTFDLAAAYFKTHPTASVLEFRAGDDAVGVPPAALGAPPSRERRGGRRGGRSDAKERLIIPAGDDAGRAAGRGEGTYQLDLSS